MASAKKGLAASWALYLGYLLGLGPVELVESGLCAFANSDSTVL